MVWGVLALFESYPISLFGSSHRPGRKLGVTRLPYKPPPRAESCRLPWLLLNDYHQHQVQVAWWRKAALVRFWNDDR